MLGYWKKPGQSLRKTKRLRGSVEDLERNLAAAHSDNDKLRQRATELFDENMNISLQLGDALKRVEGKPVIPNRDCFMLASSQFLR